MEFDPSRPVARTSGARPKRTLMIAAAVALVVVIGVVGFLVLGGDDDEAGGAAGGRFPAAVRSDPSEKVAAFEVDGSVEIVALWGDLLLAEERGPDGVEFGVLALDAGTGEQRWRHDATSVQLFDDQLLIVDDGEIVRLDREGEPVGTARSASEESELDVYRGRLYVQDDDGISVLDPSTLDVLVSGARALSPNGRFVLAVDAEGSDTELAVHEIGGGEPEPFVVDGSPSARVLDDGRVLTSDDGELVVWSRAGEELARASLDGGSIDDVISGPYVLISGDDARTLWTVDGEPREVSGYEIDGDFVETDRSDLYVAEDEVVRLTGEGFEPVGRVDGEVDEDVAVGVIYALTDDAVIAYSTADANELWTLDRSDDQEFVVLDGKVALVDDESAGVTRVEVYG